MRVYRISGDDPVKGLRNFGWVRTEGQAKTAKKEIKFENPDIKNLCHEPDDIPTDKAGLLEWLNTWCAPNGMVHILAKVMGVEYNVEEMLKNFFDDEVEEEYHRHADLDDYEDDGPEFTDLDDED